MALHIGPGEVVDWQMPYLVQQHHARAVGDGDIGKHSAHAAGAWLPKVLLAWRWENQGTFAYNDLFNMKGHDALLSRRLTRMLPNKPFPPVYRIFGHVCYPGIVSRACAGAWCICIMRLCARYAIPQTDASLLRWSSLVFFWEAHYVATATAGNRDAAGC